MKIPLYDIFADNFIIQLATEAEDVEILQNYVQIDEDELMKLLKMIASIAEGKEKQKQEIIKKAKNKKQKEGVERNIIIPFAGNDSRTGWKDTLSCYSYPENIQLSEILRNFEIKECKKVASLSFMRPEWYEFNRSMKKVEMKVDAHYVLLAMAGWVLTNISSTGNTFINIFSPQGGILFSLNKKIGGKIPGVRPETAFSLWITKKILDTLSSNTIVSYIKVYTLSRGSNTINLTGEFNVDTARILSKPHLLTYTLERIAYSALQDKNELRDYYIRLVSYIYQYITNSKKIDELLYFANRDVLITEKSNDEVIKEVEEVSNYVNTVLYREALAEGLL